MGQIDYKLFSKTQRLQRSFRCIVCFASNFLVAFYQPILPGHLVSTPEKRGEPVFENRVFVSVNAASNRGIVNVSALVGDSRSEDNAMLGSSSGLLKRFEPPLRFEFARYVRDQRNESTHGDIRNLSLAGFIGTSNDIGKVIDFRIGNIGLSLGPVREIGLAFAKQSLAHPRFNRINARTVSRSFACPTV